LPAKILLFGLLKYKKSKIAGIKTRIKGVIA
jgi:hypothetical protein